LKLGIRTITNSKTGVLEQVALAGARAARVSIDERRLAVWRNRVDTGVMRSGAANKTSQTVEIFIPRAGSLHILLGDFMSRQMRLNSCLLLLVPVWLMVLQAATGIVQAEDLSRSASLEFFESKIRPVLVEQCYGCHNTARKQEGGLSVDSRGGLLKGGDSGPAVIPGDPGKSLLLQAIRYEIDGSEMPKSAPRLSQDVVSHFEAWIREGALDPRDEPPSAEDLAEATSWESTMERRKQWWSLQPIDRPSVPAVHNSAWCRNEIDNFILSGLEHNQLQPAPDAAAGVLIRRAFFTLTGLPPRPEEIARWQPKLEVENRTQRDQNYASLIDELLARAEFGEHWARHWMDWMRYAESHGSEGDPEIGQAWQYRDYLIRALNADVPYDQLVREHIAGDLLQTPRLNEQLQINESLIGPAHWRMVFHGFTPTDALDEKVRFIDDEINVFSKAFLGLTVSCARCHNHKFDAISQADYYALFGILGSCRPGRNVIDLPAVQQKNIAELKAVKSQLRNELAAQWLAQLPQLTTNWFDKKEVGNNSILALWQQFQQQVTAGTTPTDAWNGLIERWKKRQQMLEDVSAKSHLYHWDLGDPAQVAQWFLNGQGLSDAPAAAGEFTVSLSDEKVLSEIFPRGIYSHALSSRHAARLSSLEFPVDGDREVWMQLCGDGGALARYVVQQYPRNGTVYPVVRLTPDWRWAKLDMSYWKGDDLYLEFETARDAPVPAGGADRSWFGVREVLVTNKGFTPPAADVFDRLETLLNANDAPPVQSLADLQLRYQNSVSSAIRNWQNGTLTDSQALLLDACLRESLLPNTFSALPMLQPLVEQYRKLEAEIAVPQRVPGLDETVGRDQPLMVRGDHKHPGEVVPRRFLEAISPTPYQTQLSGRLQLAEDVLHEKNPLTRRVVVNRVWHHLFSQGLVRTPDNFGKMGELPTHPELLDWLALRFPEQGWSFKALIRELLLSHTWQLDSTPSPESLAADPDNRWLSHAHVRRLEAESIRDAILQVSGLLDRTRFGPPVSGTSSRRSLYVAVRRNSLDPFLRVFDFPEPFSTTGRRDVTNVPAQALTLMNDDQVVRAAAAWTAAILKADSPVTETDRIQSMFLTAFGRLPAPEEIDSALRFIDQSERLHLDLIARQQQLHQEIDQLSNEINQFLQLARSRGPAEEPATAISPPVPLVSWDFDDHFNDAIQGNKVRPVGQATLQNGALVCQKGSHAVSEPLQVTLKEKTLEAWVQLDTLEQRGGGIISIQSRSGDVFDAIVFGEMTPGEWLAGSDYFRRTKAFHGPREQEAAERPVHLAVTYRLDGTIAFYRDGVPYGTPISSSGPVEFPAGKTVLTFGLRHLPANAERAISGRILLAQVYDHALSPEEIQNSFRAHPQPISQQQLWERLTDKEREQITTLRDQKQMLQQQLDAIPSSSNTSTQTAWTDLARGLLLMKEFIYLQ